MYERNIKELEINGQKYISLSEYAKKHNVSIRTIQMWIYQGQLAKPNVERVSRVLYVNYVKADAIPVFKRKNRSRKIKAPIVTKNN